MLLNILNKGGLIILLNILNVLGMFLILLSLVSLALVLIGFISKKEFILNKLAIPFTELVLGFIIIIIVSLNNNYISTNSQMYTNPNNAIPLSINVVSGSKISYNYDKRYVYKFRHDGQDLFRLSPVNIKSSTMLKVTQKYRNNFLVPTIKTDNIKIIKKN
jgi:hypothetical protein